MPIPWHLDTFYLDDRVVTPQVLINKRTMQPVIYIQVTDAITGAVVEAKVVSDEVSYLEYVESLLGN